MINHYQLLKRKQLAEVNKIWVLGCLALICLIGNAQSVSSITIEQCYQWAEENYPLAKQRALIDKSREYNLDNLSKAIYPQLSIGGQATYQSDVPSFDVPIPGYKGVVIPKDQYKLYGEVSQPLTDFGVIKQQKDLLEKNALIQEGNLSVELYKLHERINQLFFGILMIDEQLAQNVLLKRDVNAGISKVTAAINNGTDFRSSLDKLKAEYIKAEQRDIELVASRTAYAEMLGLFINTSIAGNTKFIGPTVPKLLQDSIARPELKVFDLQLNAYQLQKELLKTKYTPKLNLFIQGGMGRPNPVNFLSDEWKGYYLGGLRLNWNLNGLYTLKKEKLVNEIDQQLLKEQRNTFLFNTNLQLKQQNQDIVKLQQLLKSDKDIVQLRESVKNTAAIQLENGVITTNDYLREVNAEDQARQNLILHQLQLLMTQYAYKTTSGN